MKFTELLNNIDSIVEKERYEKASLGSGISAVNPVQMVDLSLGEADPIPQKEYDIVVANILADVIIPLSSIAPGYMKKGGIFITSGISADRVENVVSSMNKAGLNVLETELMGEWAAVVSEK